MVFLNENGLACIVRLCSCRCCRMIEEGRSWDAERYVDIHTGERDTKPGSRGMARIYVFLDSPAVDSGSKTGQLRSS